MQLKTRIEILLFTVMILFVALASVVQRYIVYNSFVRLEQTKAEEDIERCVEAVKRESHHLTTQQRDWSRWDATFAFMEDHNPDYITTNLADNTFTSARFNLVYLVDTTGRVVWGKVLDTTAGEVIHLKSFPDDQWPANSPLLAREDAQETFAGVMLTERGPMLVAAGPVLDNNARGPFRGTLVIGRFFDARGWTSWYGRFRRERFRTRSVRY